MSLSWTLISASAAATRALGAALAVRLRAGDVILLHGDLGSGKTTLVQGIAGGLGVAEPAASPTFTIANEYAGRDGAGSPITVAHLDLYRLHGDADLESIGLDDYLRPGAGLTLVEWPERAANRVGAGMLLISLSAAGPDTRRLELRELGETSRHAWLGAFVTGEAHLLPGISVVSSDTLADPQDR